MPARLASPAHYGLAALSWFLKAHLYPALSFECHRFGRRSIPRLLEGLKFFLG